MDGQRFEMLLKSVGAGGTRRWVLRGVVAGALGVGTGGALRAGRAAPPAGVLPI